MRTLFATCLVLLMLGGCNEKQNASKERINRENLASKERIRGMELTHDQTMAEGAGRQQALILDKTNAQALIVMETTYAALTPTIQWLGVFLTLAFVVYQIRLLLARGLDVYETRIRLQYRSAQNNNPVFEGTARVITSKSLLIQ